MTSPQGLDRGASQEVVYDGRRLLPLEPSRLFVDEKTTAGWRKRGFFSIFGQDDDPSTNLVRLMLELGAAHSFAPGQKLPASVSLSRDSPHSCPHSEDFADYIEDHPQGGMPYATAPLSEREITLLAGWLDAGAPLAVHPTPLPQDLQEEVAEWEGFLNGVSLRERITARYLYEHWFLAHLYFDDFAQGPFFRIVRSSSPPGKPVDEIATRRPYDDPGDAPFWYRLRPITATLVHKTHTVYELSPARKKRLTELFLETSWSPTSLPDYEPETASNPFVTFAEIPARARYQYLLDDAQYFVMTFIRGPVCSGQVAVNVIQDHFFVAFLDPDHDLSITNPNFLPTTQEDLNLPAAHLNRLVPGEFFGEYGIEQRAYLDRREDFYSAADPDRRGPDLDWLWNGDNTNPNALLTVFRHWDNATVTQGWVGGAPKTAWVIDYPIFERIYYDLVAGFDVFGNVAHQAATRLYMDHLRMQSENNFLSFLPAQRREEIHASWYEGATQSLDYKHIDYLRDTERGTQVVFTRDDVKTDLLDQILAHQSAVAGPPDLLNRCKTPPCPRQDATALEAHTEFTLQTLTAVHGRWVAELPEVTRLRVRNGKEAIAYTLVHNRARTNVAYMFGEDTRLVPSADTLTIVRGYVGSYPNFAFDVSIDELTAFRDQLIAVNGPDAFAALTTRFGVRRTSPHFWETMDWLAQDFQRRRPTKAGLFDLGRYENL